MTLGHLMIICYIVQQFILLFLRSVKFQNTIFFKIYIKNIKYLLFVRVLLSFPQFPSNEAVISHRVAPYI
jgi:hypothetical protein